MAAPLTVSIPHSLGREEARRRLQSGLTRAAAQLPVLTVEDERWDGDRMSFRVRAIGQTVSGEVDVADDKVTVQLTLPWLLQKFGEAARTAIQSRGKLLLTKRS